MSKNITIYWNKNNYENINISLIDLVEEDAINLKKKYIDFIFSVSSFDNSQKLNIDKNFNILWMSIIHEKNFYKSINIEYALKLFALFRYLKNNSFNYVILENVPKICKKSIKDIEKEIGVKIKIIYEKDESKTLSLKYYTPLIINSFYTILKYYIKSFKFKKKKLDYLNIKKNINKNKNILIVSYLLNYNKKLLLEGVFHSDYWGKLPSELKKRGYSIDWLHVFGDSNKQLNEFITTTNNITKNNNNENHYFLEKNFSLNIFFEVIIKYFKLIFANYKLYFAKKNFKFRESNINLWDIFKNDWRDSIFGSLAIRNILVFKLFKKNADTLPPSSKVLYLHEGQGWEKALINNFRLNTELIGVIQSPIRFWDVKIYDYVPSEYNFNKYKFYFPDNLAINSEFGFKMINEINNLTPLSKVEPLRAEPIFQTEDKLIKSKNNSKIKILILGGYHIKLTNDLINYMYMIISTDLKKKYNFKFRFHPGYINKELVKYNHIDQNSNIYESINNHEIIIVTGDSSSSVDAYNLNKKIIIYLGEKSLNINPLRKFKGIEIARNIHDIKNKINFLSDNLNEKQKINEKYYYIDRNLSRWIKLIINK